MWAQLYSCWDLIELCDSWLEIQFISAVYWHLYTPTVTIARRLRSVVLQPYRPESLTTRITVHFHTRLHFILFFLHCIKAPHWRPLATDNQRREWQQPLKNRYHYFCERSVLPLLPLLLPQLPPCVIHPHPLLILPLFLIPPPTQSHLFYRPPSLTLLQVPPAVAVCAHLRRMWSGRVGGGEGGG